MESTSSVINAADPADLDSPTTANLLALTFDWKSFLTTKEASSSETSRTNNQGYTLLAREQELSEEDFPSSSSSHSESRAGITPQLEWASDLGNTSWYVYSCERTGESRLFSSFNLVSTSITGEQNPSHNWKLSSTLTMPWNHCRCPHCGTVFSSTTELVFPPPAWCRHCSAQVQAWLPVVKQPYLTVTWFNYWCEHCSRHILIGNDAFPAQCIRCLSYDTILHRVIAVLPSATLPWLPSTSWAFPETFLCVIRTVLLAKYRLITRSNDNICVKDGRVNFVPNELLYLVFGYMVPNVKKAPVEWLPPVATERQSGNDYAATLLQSPTNGEVTPPPLRF